MFLVALLINSNCSTYIKSSSRRDCAAEIRIGERCSSPMTLFSVFSIIFYCAVIILLPKSVSNCENGICIDSEREAMNPKREISLLRSAGNLLWRAKRNDMSWRSGADSNKGLVENLQR